MGVDIMRIETENVGQNDTGQEFILGLLTARVFSSIAYALSVTAESIDVAYVLPTARLVIQANDKNILIIFFIV